MTCLRVSWGTGAVSQGSRARITASTASFPAFAQLAATGAAAYAATTIHGARCVGRLRRTPGTPSAEYLRAPASRPNEPVSDPHWRPGCARRANHPGNSGIARVIVDVFGNFTEEKPLDGIKAHLMILCGGIHTRLALSDRVLSKRSGALGLCCNGRAF
jgi:hypothetical protein